jgi:hypothetical protein
VIPAVRLGTKVFRMGADQLLFLRGPAAADYIAQPGSQRLELQHQANLRDPERWGEPLFTEPRWWRDDPRGFALRDLNTALQRHQHLLRIARNLTPEQEAALWSDTGAEAAALRRAMALDSARARPAG